MGGQKPFLPPPIIRREFVIFFILFKTWKKAETETKKEKYKEKGVHFEWRVSFFEKTCWWLKRDPQKFQRIEGDFFKIFRMLSENIFSQNFCFPNICDLNFCPPIFMTSLRRWSRIECQDFCFVNDWRAADWFFLLEAALCWQVKLWASIWSPEVSGSRPEPRGPKVERLFVILLQNWSVGLLYVRERLRTLSLGQWSGCLHESNSLNVRIIID